ncbi:MAG: hypothetical protein OEZ58_01045 [Gammaproteobacteria bacterium]|nr:hypothetical protein [Gammaproteobacteria bacterium]MDH5727562.1 hypothetical protein [Gammaproteobacteria bacterium]
MAMKNSHPLITDFHVDILREVVNIGMGQAGALLATLLHQFVKLSIPEVSIIEAKDINFAISRIVGDHQQVDAVRQAFFKQWHGEAIVIYPQNETNNIANLMGHSADSQDLSHTELLLDLSNIQVGACLNGIAKQLNIVLNYAAPAIFAEQTYVEKLFNIDDLSWRQCLMMEVNFAVEDDGFKSHLFIFLTEDSVPSLIKNLERFMDQYQ